mgnify:CR=1 FL=1
MKISFIDKSRKTIFGLSLALVFVLTPSFVLLIASSWSNDDYGLAKLFQTSGLDGLASRVFFGSPRFLSESVLYIYYHLIVFFQRPFTGIFLLTLWLLLILSLLISLKNIINEFSLFYKDKKILKKRTIINKNL